MAVHDEMTFSKWLTKKIEEGGRGYQTLLAEALGTSPDAITLGKQGARKPGHKFIEAIATQLNVDRDFVFALLDAERAALPRASKASQASTNLKLVPYMPKSVRSRDKLLEEVTKRVQDGE